MQAERTTSVKVQDLEKLRAWTNHTQHARSTENGGGGQGERVLGGWSRQIMQDSAGQSKEVDCRSKRQAEPQKDLNHRTDLMSSCTYIESILTDKLPLESDDGRWEDGDGCGFKRQPNEWISDGSAEFTVEVRPRWEVK